MQASIRALLAVPIVLGGALVDWPDRPAADAAPPVLVVPASPVTLQVAADLPEALQELPSGAIQLVELGASAPPIGVQLVPALAPDGSAARHKRRLLADLPPRPDAGRRRRFRLEAAAAAGHDAQAEFRLAEIDGRSIKLLEGRSPVLVYNYGQITCEEVPRGDHRRRRGCYVHPLWGLHGEVLTADFPGDHFHHHGIFWAWPHVGIEGRQYDLWLYGDIKPKFVRWICRETGPVAAVLGVENGWFVDQEKVMVERVWLRAYPAAHGRRSLDLEFAWIPVRRPVTLQGAGGKSYGGLTVRFAAEDREQTVITVPSGRTKEDLKMARLPWADLASVFAPQRSPSGAAVFVHPQHPGYPPTWLTRHYGPLCVGWPGVEPKTFPPGKPIRLSYRIWIHADSVEVDQLKRAYAAYCDAAKATWE